MTLWISLLHDIDAVSLIPRGKPSRRLITDHKKFGRLLQSMDSLVGSCNIQHSRIGKRKHRAGEGIEKLTQAPKFPLTFHDL